MSREENQPRFDLLVPGYNYCGPFNPEDNGEPVNFTDECCREHDLAYKELGPSAYFYFNEADAILLERIKDETDYGAVLARNYFQTKRRWSSHSDKPFPAEETWKMFRGKRSADEIYEDKFGQTKRRGDKFVPVPTPDLQPIPEIPRSATRIDEPGSSFTRPIVRARPRPTQVTPAIEPPVSVEISPEGEMRKIPGMQPRSLDMDTAMDTSELGVSAARSAAPSGGEGAKSSHETPVDDNRPQYGLKETATVILPYCAQATIIGPSNHVNTGLTKIQLRLNSPWDPIVTGLNTINGSRDIAPGFYSEAISRKALATSGTNWPNPYELGYPEPVLQERPAWRDYWAAHYLVYHVMETEVTVTVKLLNKSDNNQAMGIWYGTDQFAGANVNNVFPIAYPNQVRHWPNVMHKVVGSNEDGTSSDTAVVKFLYKPGNLKHMVTNDEDQKTWTKISDTSNTAIKDYLTIFFGKHWTNRYSGHDVASINIDLRYKVQFKDLKQAYWYPTNIPIPAITVNDILCQP
jgi:hypothetical protein